MRVPEEPHFDHLYWILLAFANDRPSQRAINRPLPPQSLKYTYLMHGVYIKHTHSVYVVYILSVYYESLNEGGYVYTQWTQTVDCVGIECI